MNGFDDMAGAKPASARQVGFDESKVRRGQPGNAGQFRSYERPAPDRSIALPEGELGDQEFSRDIANRSGVAQRPGADMVQSTAWYDIGENRSADFGASKLEARLAEIDAERKAARQARLAEEAADREARARIEEARTPASRLAEHAVLTARQIRDRLGWR